MNIGANYQRFKKHFDNGGLSFAFRRGIKYFLFSIKKRICKINLSSEAIIKKGNLKITCSEHGIDIFCNNSEALGLNVGINTLGLWTDSSHADWQILEEGIDHFNVKVIFKDLPLSQIWSINIKDEQEIDLKIDADIEEWLYINEFRIAGLANYYYKTWFDDCQQADFLGSDNNWHDLYLSNHPNSLVGARFPLEGMPLPSFMLQTQDKNWFSFIQNPPSAFKTHIVGFRHTGLEGNRYYSPGYHHLFSGTINLFKDDYLLDIKMENLRKDFSEKTVDHGARDKESKRKLKVVLVNLPWQRNGKWGVRAGSRWPHIKDESEGLYLPFPFFLAYATSLLRKHNIEAHVIDAVAEQIPEDIFMERILAMDFDYLVAETSVPSYYDDLNLLEKIHKTGISVILCGPNSEIYKPQFLKEHLFIDFVLCREYEFSLLELIKSLQENKDLSKPKGLIYRMDNKVIKNTEYRPFDINLLPWPEREQLPMDKYWDLPGDIPFPSVQMLASRGCPFGCNFCLWPQVLYQNNLYRTRNINEVVDEMEYLVKERKFKSVYFDDDTFNIGKERMLKLSQLIRERDLQNVPWAIMARPDLMDERILSEMKSAGLWSVKYGVESVCKKLLDSCQKNMDFKRTDRIIKITKNLGIRIHLTFTFGLPGETRDSIQRTIDYALSLNTDSAQFSILTPFPGTRLFEELDKQGRILTKDWSNYDGHYHCVFQPDNLIPRDLEKGKRRAYLLWGDHKRRKRGLLGDMIRFKDYLLRYGFKSAVHKTLDYLRFVWVKRERYLNGEN